MIHIEVSGKIITQIFHTDGTYLVVNKRNKRTRKTKNKCMPILADAFVCAGMYRTCVGVARGTCVGVARGTCVGVAKQAWVWPE